MSDFVDVYICKNKQQVTIKIDDTSYVVSVFDQGNREIGRFEFVELDGLALKLTWCYLDFENEKYKRQGIGRHIIKLMKERFNLPISAEDHDGIQKNDGSHLTCDAPGFVAKMRQEGLIEHSKRSIDEGIKN